MSQMADVEDIVKSQPLTVDEKAKLFSDLLDALGWDYPDGVFGQSDMKTYLFELDR